MFISEEKKKTNIAEYVLYMWHIEDVIRACSFDIESIKNHVIVPQQLDEEKSHQLEQWYIGLIKKMKLQRIEKSGHLRDLSEIVNELSLLHQTLLDYYKDEKYADIFSKAEVFLEDFRKVAKAKTASHIALFFEALYGKLILKLKQKEISEASEEAFAAFTKALGYLSIKYNEMKQGTLV